jgi:hypothetical protein
VGTGFRKRSCSTNNLERDDDSKRSHHALEAETGQNRVAAFAGRGATIPAGAMAHEPDAV